MSTKHTYHHFQLIGILIKFPHAYIATNYIELQIKFCFKKEIYN